MILVATGSEVQIAVAARELLQADGIPTRVVSMPCREWFARAGPGLPRRGAAARGPRPGLASRPAVAQGWREIVGDAGRCVSLEHFGASADYQKLYDEFGFTTEHVAAGPGRASLAGRAATPDGGHTPRPHATIPADPAHPADLEE